LVGVGTANAASGQAAKAAVTHAGPTSRAGGGGTGRAARVVDLAALPAATLGPVTRTIPSALSPDLGPRFVAREQTARHSAAAPVVSQASLHPAPQFAGTAGAQTPGASKVFKGQHNSAATCPYFGGCAPPDEAIASSKSFVVQLINTSIAIYSPTGHLQTGFPKNLESFFGVPNPSPAGCDSHGPFLSDPRAAYDPNSGRFYATIMQIEGPGTPGSACTASSTVWFAVSTSSNPTGSWYVYSLAIPGVTSTSACTASAAGVCWSDYTQFGFDTQGLYWSYNLYTSSGALGSNVVFGIRKAELLTGAGFYYWYFPDLTFNGTLLDTINPVQSLGHTAGPQGEVFIGSYNIDWGGGQCSSGCSGLVLWDFSNIAFSGSSNPSLTGLGISSDSYALSPGADDPGSCTACLEAEDTRISATPKYQHGQVFGALETAVNNGSGSNVPGILWFDVNVYFNAGPSTCPECTTINSSTAINQQGYFVYAGARDAFFPTIGPDSEGNLIMGFEYTSTPEGYDPSQVFVGRRVTLPPGSWSDSGIFAMGSTTPSIQERQGDFAASSWTGPDDDSVWTAGEYSCPTSGNWCTAIWHNSWSIASN
jgi:hypothetical protein